MKAAVARFTNWKRCESCGTFNPAHKQNCVGCDALLYNKVGVAK